MQLAKDNVTKIDSNTANLNPMEQIPILEFVETTTGEKHVLTQSMAIMEFLDEVFPTCGIYPAGASPTVRARVRQVCNASSISILSLSVSYVVLFI
jgi:glutathione S-transferase